MTDDAPSSLQDEGETEDERLDRNWNEMLQELRVTQTGTQILTGFLLTLPFQQRFTDLSAVQVDIYLVLVVVAGITTALGLAPVSLHRQLFRRGAKAQIVRLTNLFVKATLAGVAAVLTGTVLLIFDVVWSLPAAIGIAAGVLALTLIVWLLFPALVRPRPRR
ncbi:DUF6328 family protein [Galbitalea sp. SE-J8]|uniref:DUF6328 family protein n=1 Tax=Galbitalea sp. SE-J8 TaxID=3054952 RepID=UPI00259C8013|nr:DUF6328 family protein [Galbitalea sp. SE-J8]MDM4762608.1 DUF6328 family protein [Galbitalea sp. SE-J8]